MAIIIPSKHIYKKENNKVVNNAISAIDQNISNVTVEYGNVLSRTLNFNFYDFSTDTPTALYNDNKNTEGFDFHTTSSGANGNIDVSARLRLKIEKNTIVKTFMSQNGLALSSPNIRSIHTYYHRKNDATTGKYYYEIKEAPLISIDPLIVSYDEKTNILEMDISRTINYSGGSIYLASETFELVSDYIVADISSIKFGSGTNVFSLSSNEITQYNSIISNSFGEGKVTSQLSSDSHSGIEKLEFFCILDLASGTKIIYNGEVATVKDIVSKDETGTWYGIFAPNGGEFSQSTGSTIKFKIASDINFSEYFAQTIFDKYQNGRETAKLKCGIADYFDESGNNVVSTSKKVIAPYNGEVSVYTVDDYTIKAEIRLEPDEEQDKDVTIEVIIEEEGGSYVEKIYIQKHTNFSTYSAQGKVLSVQLKSAYFEETKMCFGIGDIVVPYVRNEYGSDAPLSSNEDGYAKTFKVVDVEFIYDGAVWQDLNLIEYALFLNKLDAPTISLNESILTITDGSGLAEQFDILVDGKVVHTVKANYNTDANEEITFDLSTLYLESAEHTVTVKSKRKYYNDSENSNSVIYGKDLLYELSQDGSYYKVIGIGNYDKTDVVIPSLYKGLPISIIGEYAFQLDSITSVIIGSNVTTIELGAFFGCTSLKSVTIGDIVTSIGSSAFQNCTSLTSVIIGNGVTIIEGGTFENCSSLTSVTIGNNVTTIGVGAFYNCTSLTSFAIPNSVTTIGDWAFRGCSSITSITIPDSVTSIGDSAFSGCASLQSITLPFVGGSKSTTSESLSSLFGYIFGTYLYTGGVATQQSSASSSATYYIPSLLKSVTVTGGNILQGAFENCMITSVTIGNGVTSIGFGAFTSCSNLTSVTIGYRVEEIAGSAFFNCSSLKNIKIGTSVRSIGEHAFESCSSLTSLTIPESTVEIYQGAFYGCESLNSVTFEGNDMVWYIMNYENSYNKPVNVSNKEQNAIYLKNTYVDYKWEK